VVFEIDWLIVWGVFGYMGSAEAQDNDLVPLTHTGWLSSPREVTLMEIFNAQYAIFM
jgi:hypothetical protein